MKQLKKLIKMVPGVTLTVNKARAVVQLYEYRKSLSRIKNTKEIIKQRHTIDPNRKIVVSFIIQYLPSWNYLKPVYEKLKDSSDFEVLLLCVPSQLNEDRVVKENCFSERKQNDTFEYLKKQGYDCIDAFNGGEWFNLEEAQPDFVFHSRPFNHFMPDQYRTSSISTYALICNVLYGPSVLKYKGSMNKDFYKDVYCYFSIDKLEAEQFRMKFHTGVSNGLQKCYPYATTGLEQILKFKIEKKADSFKKTVLWTPRWSTDPNVGGSNFFNYLDTIKTLIEQFSDVMFIIRPHPLMFGNFVKTGEMTEEEVTSFKKYCKKKRNVHLDEEKEYTDTIWQTDFLITDISGIIVEYYVTNKPMIFCASTNSSIYQSYVYEMLKCSYVVNDSEELIDSFNLLYNNGDYKKNDREKSVSNIFGEIEGSSTRIVEFLRKEIKR